MKWWQGLGTESNLFKNKILVIQKTEGTVICGQYFGHENKVSIQN